VVNKAEAVTIADAATATNIFTFTISEPITSVISNQSISAQFVVVDVENVNMNDLSTQQSNYLQSITEAITLLDVLCYNGWFRIDDSQFAGWTAITTPSGVWVDINNAQTPGWDTIDTSQPCS